MFVNRGKVKVEKEENGILGGMLRMITLKWFALRKEKY